MELKGDWVSDVHDCKGGRKFICEKNATKDGCDKEAKKEAKEAAEKRKKKCSSQKPDPEKAVFDSVLLTLIIPLSLLVVPQDTIHSDEGQPVKKRPD